MVLKMDFSYSLLIQRSHMPLHTTINLPYDLELKIKLKRNWLRVFKKTILL